METSRVGAMAVALPATTLGAIHENIGPRGEPPEVIGLPMRRPSYVQPAEIRNASTTASLPFKCRSSRSASG
jgi:hypothetical protein